MEQRGCQRSPVLVQFLYQTYNGPVVHLVGTLWAPLSFKWVKKRFCVNIFIFYFRGWTRWLYITSHESKIETSWLLLCITLVYYQVGSFYLSLNAALFGVQQRVHLTATLLGERLHCLLT